MSLSERLDRLREQKRRELLDAVLSGAVPGVVRGMSQMEWPRRNEREARDAGPLFDLVEGCRFEVRGECRVLVRRVSIPFGGGAGYALPRGDYRVLADPQELHRIYPGLDEVGPSFSPSRIAFVDTETTGLSGGAGTCAFLVAVGWIDELARCFVSEQFFIEDYAHEALQLQLVAERLEQFDVLASYNGKAFDLPLLRARGTLHRLRPAVWRKPHADLLFFSRRLWRGAFENVSLGTVEREVFALARAEDIPGSEIPQVWQEFREMEKLARILHHNAQDIASLAALMVHHVEMLRRADAPGQVRRFHEAAGLARWFERGRDWERCCAMYARAVDLAPGSEAEEMMLLDLARVCRRRGDWDRAIQTWTSLSRRTGSVALRAGIELAKVAEHRDQNPESALARVLMARNAVDLEREIALVTGRRYAPPPARLLEDLDRREARLRNKVQRKRRKGRDE